MKLGIIGGIGPESTIEYYRQVVSIYRSRKPDGSYPSFLVNSINLTRLLDMMTTNALAEAADDLLEEVRALARAGAEFGLIAANTPHIVFDDLERRSPIPLLSIVQATCDAARTLGLKRVALFGTRFTMQGHFYPDLFAREGIEIVVPDLDDGTYIHDRYMKELIHGIFLPETRDDLLAIVDRLIDRNGIEGVILGGTELPLILRDATHRGIPLLDTTRIHVEAAVTQMLVDRP
jgi:aspartate racemase